MQPLHNILIGWPREYVIFFLRTKIEKITYISYEELQALLHAEEQQSLKDFESYKDKEHNGNGGIHERHI